MTAPVTVELDDRGRVIPLNEQIERLDGETPEAWTDRLLAIAGEQAHTKRQCSIGWHLECSDPKGEECRCTCHPWPESVQSAPIVWGARESPMGWEPGEGWVDIPEVVEVYLDGLRTLVKRLRDEVADRVCGRDYEAQEKARVDELVAALGLEDDWESE